MQKIQFTEEENLLTDYTTISVDELESLRKDSFELQCLHAGGVDNWEWYSESLQRGGYFDNDD